MSKKTEAVWVATIWFIVSCILFALSRKANLQVVGLPIFASIDLMLAGIGTLLCRRSKTLAGALMIALLSLLCSIALSIGLEALTSIGLTIVLFILPVTILTSDREP
jgi:hypothetical protein